MNHELLTPDRIEAARTLFKNHIEMLERELDILPGEEIYADVTREEIEHHETVIAALDLADQLRWRKPEEADSGSKAMVIAILADNSRENTFECVVAKYPQQHKAYMLLPKWKGEVNVQ